MAAKKEPKPPYICPACGSTRTAKVSWSGQIGENGQDEYQGLWVECLDCGLQGPKKVWDHMAKRRTDLGRALDIADPSDHQKRYMEAIELFGQKMFRELAANDPKKGDFLAWAPSAEQASSELEHHFWKLMGGIRRGKKLEVSEFAADMGNIAMAIDRQLGAK